MNQTVNQTNPLGSADIKSLIIKFSVPAIISFLVTAVYNIVDQIFIGKGIGMLGMAATNVAFPLTTICTALALLIGVGGAANFNLNLGAGNKKEASFFAGNALTLSVISGIIIGIISLIFLKPMLVVFGATEQSMAYAFDYTWIIVLGVPFQIFMTAANNLIRADGSPSYAMISMLAGAIFNVVFDPIFIFMFDMGIQGIALATTLGQVLSSVISFVYFIKKFRSVPIQKKHLKVQTVFAKRIASLGAAASVNQLAMTAVQITMNNTMKHYGSMSAYGSDIPIAVVGAISKINILVLAFTLGVSQGLQPITSFNYGAGNYDRVRKGIKIGLKLVCIVSVIAFIIFQLFPRQIISIFGEGDEVYFSFAIKYLRIFMFMTFINGIQPLTANFFTSIGKSKLGVIMSLTRQVLLLIPLMLLLSLSMGIDGVLYSGPIADGLAAILSMVLLKREWRKLNIKSAKAEVAMAEMK